MEVEDDVELADVAEVTVEDLHEEVDHLQRHQLVVGLVDAGDEEERGVALVDHLGEGDREELGRAGVRLGSRVTWPFMPLDVMARGLDREPILASGGVGGVWEWLGAAVPHFRHMDRG